MTRISTAPTRTSDTRHHPRLIATIGRAALEAAALAAFVAMALIWADALAAL